MFSTVLPAITECGPQELLPIMPPSVQRECVAGSGAKVRPCALGGLAQRVAHHAGLDAREARRRRRSRRTRSRYFEQSMTTATFTALAADARCRRRARSTGAPCSRHTATAATMSSTLLRQHDADRHLPIVRRVGGIGGARAGVEAHFAGNYCAQCAPRVAESLPSCRRFCHSSLRLLIDFPGR